MTKTQTRMLEMLESGPKTADQLRACLRGGVGSDHCLRVHLSSLRKELALYGRKVLKRGCFYSVEGVGTTSQQIAELVAELGPAAEPVCVEAAKKAARVLRLRDFTRDRRGLVTLVRIQHNLKKGKFFS